MTSISQWLRAEELDRNEPVSFYFPGETHWPKKKMQVAEVEDWEVQELLDMKVEDEQ